MSAFEINKWLRLQPAERQDYIRQFYDTGDPELARHLLGLVRATRGYGVYASIGPNYQFAVFGRDSITVAQNLLSTQPVLAKEIICLLAHFQGTAFNMVSEEEPGKIHHEYRARQFGEHRAPKAAQTVLDRLRPHWGGSEDELLYYGSFDATPLFIRLVYKYCQLYDRDILQRSIVGRDGKTRPLRDHVRMAAGWLTTKLTASPWRLFEYKRLNPVGLYNQNWQDSEIAYIHTDGTLANADSGIASIEAQGYAYDALRAAAELVAAKQEEADAWRHLASIIRDNTLMLLWMPDKKYFAAGLDRDTGGRTRQIATLTANAGLLLATDILKLLPEDHAWPYIDGVVRTLFGEDFMTPAGCRNRALQHAPLVSFADYHGSQVTWPRENFEIATGLRYHGFYGLAALLEECIMQSVARAGEFYEFFFVNTKGQVKYHYRQENPDEPTFHDFGAANLPDPGQAWTLSAILNIVAARHTVKAQLPVLAAVHNLEQSILKRSHIKNLGVAAK